MHFGLPVFVVKFIDLCGNDKHQIQARGREGGGVPGVENPGELSSVAECASSFVSCFSQLHSDALFIIVLISHLFLCLESCIINRKVHLYGSKKMTPILRSCVCKTFGC